jgi:DSF synthase
MGYFDFQHGGLPSPTGKALAVVRPDPLRLRLPKLQRAADVPERFPPQHFCELEINMDEAHSALWCHMRPAGPPSFTPSLLRELIALRRAIHLHMRGRPAGDGLRFFIGASRLPGIYNLGGDLQHFVAMIRQKDREALRAYAVDCCDVAYHMAMGFDAPILTIALVQGDALGGGFEGAMSFNILVAERSAKMGMPEVLFNLFPGMGAMSFLSRKIGLARAQRMILSGKIYSAEELYDLGVVDILAEDGRGEEEVRKFIAGGEARYRLHHALAQARQRVAPLTFEELRDITCIWVDTAMHLGESDLRRMERLALAQRRRIDRS